MNKRNKRFIIGTVQLGLKYGLNNVSDKPTKEESFSILDKALSSGMNIFDTAWSYGNAEDIIGEWIKNRSISQKDIHIISKMKPHALNDYSDGIKMKDIVESELNKTLKRLNIDSLDGYLFHSPYYIYLNHMIEAMYIAKENGYVKNIGVSVYDEPEAMQAVELGIDYIQIPYNVFDQRLDSTDFFKLAKKNKVTVFARSPFLQGLLLMKPNQLPKHLIYLQPYLKKFIDISNKYNLTTLESSLIFANSCPADYIVFGINNLNQLNQNIDSINKISNIKHDDLLRELKETFKGLNKGAINPSLWSKIKL